MPQKKKPTFFCFSPPVMLATFMIEIVLLILALIRFQRNSIRNLIVATLFFLGFFQLCEYFVCGGLGVNAATWSRLGFIAITTLPAIGLHLIYALADKKPDWVVKFGYVLMAAWIILFGFSEFAFHNHQCVSNYVIFNLNQHISYAYSVYYYGILLLGIWLAMKFGNLVKKKTQKQTLHAMIVGYLIFLLPTAIVNTIKPETMAGIPSIMCGFAVLFALILYFYILPRSTKHRK